MSNVTLKSTKQQIMEEVIKLQIELKQVRESKLTVSEMQTSKIKEEKLEKAQELIDMNILNPDVIKQFNDVKFAIDEAKKDLLNQSNMYLIKKQVPFRSFLNMAPVLKLFI
ncbi:MAG: hypothetical protein BEN19_03765 [Epulopiscium sp. Nuni2H_MBin003]|nr:MAG: hypothetical protein BEN19_03765 [Epulopiscium sp. Nuni2H_MBin003]